jgi:hypothetical protein
MQPALASVAGAARGSRGIGSRDLKVAPTGSRDLTVAPARAIAHATSASTMILKTAASH